MVTANVDEGLAKTTLQAGVFTAVSRRPRGSLPPAPHRPPGVALAEKRHGQVAPPLLSAAVLSPLPQSTNVPVALLEYL